jgi:hypothetical protein
MRVIEKTVYLFSELSDRAKENARDWFRMSDDSDIGDEMHSIHEFCGHFGVWLMDYSVNAWGSIDYKHNAENHNFRGVKLKSVDRDAMPAGFYLDCDLWHAFYDEFKRTGDAKQAFDSAVYAGFKTLRGEMEYRQSDEYIDEMMDGYEFDEEGNRC